MKHPRCKTKSSELSNKCTFCTRIKSYNATNYNENLFTRHLVEIRRIELACTKNCLLAVNFHTMCSVVLPTELRPSLARHLVELRRIELACTKNCLLAVNFHTMCSVV